MQLKRYNEALGVYEKLATAASSCPFCIGPTLIPPTINTFTNWVNQGGASVYDNNNGSISLENPYASGDNIRLITKTIPSAPYTITSCLSVIHPFSNHGSGGLFLYNSSDGKIEGFEQGYADGVLRFGILRFNSLTVYNGRPATSTICINRFWVRVSDDNTDITWEWSIDGIHWTIVYKRARTDHVTPTHIGLAANCLVGNTYKKVIVTCLHYKES